MNYPTKEEILEEPLKIDSLIIEIITEWKKEFFKDWTSIANKEKIIRLETLLYGIVTIFPFCEKNLKIDLGDQYCYDITKKTIYLDENNPSIISALHELGHHLFGRSELEACRFSVGIFKKVFPEQYKKLVWERHMLVKNPNNIEQ